MPVTSTSNSFFSNCLSNGAVAAFTGSVIGVVERVSKGMPPGVILEKICAAPSVFSQHFNVLCATPLKHISGISVVCLQAIWKFNSLNAISQPMAPQTKRDQLDRTSSKISAFCNTTLFFFISCFNSNLVAQVFQGMAASSAIDGLAKAGRVGIARTATVFSALYFSLTVASFAHTAENCESINTTWANIGCGLVAASVGTLLETGLSPLYDRISQRLNEPTLAEYLSKGWEVLIYRDSSDQTIWRLWNEQTKTIRDVPAELIPEAVELDGSFPTHHLIVMRQGSGNDKYAFDYKIPAGDSEETRLADDALGLLHKQILSALTTKPKPSKLNEPSVERPDPSTFGQWFRELLDDGWTISLHQPPCGSISWTISNPSGDEHPIPPMRCPNVELPGWFENGDKLKMKKNQIDGTYSWSIEQLAESSSPVPLQHNLIAFLETLHTSPTNPLPDPSLLDQADWLHPYMENGAYLAIFFNENKTPKCSYWDPKTNEYQQLPKALIPKEKFTFHPNLDSNTFIKISWDPFWNACQYYVLNKADSKIVMFEGCREGFNDGLISIVQQEAQLEN